MYVLQDPDTKLYLTQNSAFKPLCSTTRYFQTKKRADIVSHKRDTYFWIAVHYDHIGKPRNYRTDVNDDFRNKVTNWLYNRTLIVTELIIKENKMNSVQQEMLDLLQNMEELEYQIKSLKNKTEEEYPSMKFIHTAELRNKVRKIIIADREEKLKELSDKYNELINTVAGQK